MSDARSSKLSEGRLSRIQGEGASARWIREHLNYPHRDWCLIWPFSRNENGYALFGRPLIMVHRLMCEHLNGPPPIDKPEGAHECGNGHLACVNPHHITWKSHSDNLRDKARHGRRLQRYKLTPAKVDEIRALKDRARVDDIAKQFDVTENTIRQIHSGRIWKNDRIDIRIFTADEVRAIRARRGQTTIAAIAREYGVNRSKIERIQRGESYKWVDGENSEAAA